MNTLEDRIRTGLHDAASRLPDRTMVSHPGQMTRSPKWMKAVAAAAGVVVLIGGAGLLRGGSTVGAGGVENLAMTQDLDVLGGSAVVVNSNLSTDGFDALPSMSVWQWEGPPTVWLVETHPDTDLTPLLDVRENGEVFQSPADDELESLELQYTEWHVRSWRDAETWRIVFGFDEAAVVEVADRLRGGIPVDRVLDGSPQSIDPRRLIPGPPVELSELFYSSPAGGFSVALFRGWPHGVESTVARFGEAATRTTINGREAVSFADDVNSWVMWAIDDQSTAAVESSDLDVTVLSQIAEAVRPVTRSEWQQRAVNPVASETSGWRSVDTVDIRQLTSEELDHARSLWREATEFDLTSEEEWASRAAMACALGAWEVPVVEHLAIEYVTTDTGNADSDTVTAAMDALWHIAATVCPQNFPEGSLEAGPPSARS